MTITALATPDPEPCTRRRFRNAIAARMELKRLDAALTSRPAIARNRRTSRYDPRMHYCDQCRAWHITHPSQQAAIPPKEA